MGFYSVDFEATFFLCILASELGLSRRPGKIAVNIYTEEEVNRICQGKVI
ncbi:MAG: hypothetical protein GY854_23775 [Deltaproteobacteria bacterium]|nr:hypothetical protein [Deltaproteobacteria bacterium]